MNLWRVDGSDRPPLSELRLGQVIAVLRGGKADFVDRPLLGQQGLTGVRGRDADFVDRPSFLQMRLSLILSTLTFQLNSNLKNKLFILTKTVPVKKGLDFFNENKKANLFLFDPMS